MTSTPLSKKALLALKRFPLVFLIALIGTIAVIQMIGLLDGPYRIMRGIDQEAWVSLAKKLKFLGSLSAVCALGIPLVLSLKLFAENTLKESKVGQWVLQFLGLALLVPYFFRLHSFVEFTAYGDLKDTGNLEWFAIEYWVLAILLHLLVAFSGFLNRDQRKGFAFWRFNKNLLVNLCFALLCSLTLFGGLSLALFALSVLLKFEVKNFFYVQLYVFIIGFLNTAFFLSMVPSRDENEAPFDPEKDYSRSLKVFTLYVLTPLLGLYLPILYLYSFEFLKKVIAGNEYSFDQALFIILIALYSAVGLLCHLLLDPLEKTEEKGRKIRIFSKIYFASVIPLLGILFWFLIRLILDRGFVYPLYYVALGAIWMLGVCVYWLIAKNRNLVWLPLSLSVLLILSLMGPWGAKSLSYSTQEQEAYLRRAAQSPSSEDEESPRSQMPPIRSEKNWHFYVNESQLRSGEIIALRRADFLVQNQYYFQHFQTAPSDFKFEGNVYQIWLEKPGILLIAKKDGLSSPIARIDWTDALKKLKDKKQNLEEDPYFSMGLPQSDLYFTFENDAIKVESFFQSFLLLEKEGVLSLTEFKTDLLLTFKTSP